ncbi:FkbM family methyltransferase [Paraglaciecola sp. 25GB23A]|uniref:FkbM family methyltransferase n=1 Tax=Paraglaciecola sp. 25GB23A TaxID=3156068 RepID=UPI0032AED6CC
MLDNYVEKTLVLSLFDDEMRRAHIKEHFEQNGIKNYHFVDAIPHGSPLVTATYKKGVVKSFPSCFRCGKSACQCGNNIIIPHQVANWLSFKRIWEIVAEATGPVLVCEDDVFFYSGGLKKLELLLDDLLLDKLHLPLLIRLGHSGLSTGINLENDANLELGINVVMSNVAHIMTPIFAQLLLEKFERIETTSDIWIHSWIANKPGVLAYTVAPLIATDLSFNKEFARFRSRIHPKGIDAEDIISAENHTKRVDSEQAYKEYLASVLGSDQAANNAIINSKSRDFAKYIIDDDIKTKVDDDKAFRLPELYPLLKNYFLPNHSDIFCAQEGEDALVRRILKWHYHKLGFYVDVGAHDPIRFSNTYHYYLKGWKGINIDPKKGMKERFDRMRPRDNNLEIGISDEKSLLTYYQFKEPAFNTFDKASVVYAQTRTELIGESSIEVKPLTAVLDECIENKQVITFFNIDVEGLEINVLKSNDWSKYRPLLVIVEALNEHALFELCNFLVQKSYTRVASTKNSYFFCENKFWEEVK